MKKLRLLIADYKNGDVTRKSKIKAFITMICGLLTAVFKFVSGTVIHSFVWAYSGVYALGSAAAKYLFFKSTRDEYDERQKTNFCIAIAVLLFLSAFIFDMCIMIKAFQEQTIAAYPLPIVIPASIYFIASYILTIVGLSRTRKNKALNLFAYKVVGLSGALMNMVLLQRMILSCLDLSVGVFKQINSTFGYTIGGALALNAVILLVRCLSVRKKYFQKHNKP